MDLGGLGTLVIAIILIIGLLLLINLIPMEPTIKKVLNIVIAVLIAIWFVSTLFGGGLPGIDLKT